MKTIMDKGIYIDLFAGSHIGDAINDALKLAKEEKQLVYFNFNGTTIKLKPESSFEDGERQFNKFRK